MTVIRRRKPFHFCQILSPLGNIARVVQLFQRHKLVLNLVATAKLDNNLPNLDKCCPHLAKRAFPFSHAQIAGRRHNFRTLLLHPGQPGCQAILGMT